MEDSLDGLRARLVGEWNNHLKLYDVKFPKSDNRLYQLLCLYEFYPNPVSQQKMSEWISKKGGKNDRQARHLAWRGWHIQTGNPNSSRMEINPSLARDELCLVSLETPNPIWEKHHQKMSEVEQNYPGFSKIIKKYKSRGCFMCGIKSDNFLPYSKIESETYQFDTIQLCKECESWCIARNVTLVVSANLIARPEMNYPKTVESHSITVPKEVEINKSIKEKEGRYESFDNESEKLDLPGILNEILSLQPMFSSLNTPEMERRGILIRKSAPSVLLSWAENHGLSTEGSDGVGRKSRIPWFRAYSRLHSPKATTGWYIVFLISFDGSAVYLSLIQGTTDYINNKFIRKPSEELASRVLSARQILGIVNERRQARFIYDMDLRGKGKLADSYSLGNVVSFRYDDGKIPKTDIIKRDFELLVKFLKILQENTDPSANRVDSLINKNTKFSEAMTQCGHSIKVTAVKRKGGLQEGNWSILVKGPRVTGISGRKTIYCKPSIYYVIRALSSFFGAYEIISPENGIEEILPL